MKGFYNLPLTRDERRLIYAKLDWADWILGCIAHFETKNDIDREKLYTSFIKRGDLATILWIEERSSYDIQLLASLLEIAAGYGHIHILSHLNELIWFYPLQSAICTGQVEVVKWMIERGAQFNEILCDEIVRNNQLEICKLVIESDAEVDGDGLDILLRWIQIKNV